ncbi:hypothetical protein KKF34_09840 [Myxococcota bacterium]|nr:hypothetical protein [Myxococcota bacterium]MBU1381085.1 hypothetical protein [Myxococcota bacterium]MBU1497166.1 hypothetical protein [Myxococcota bacterium]
MKPILLPDPVKHMIDVFLFIPAGSDVKTKPNIEVPEVNSTDFLLRKVFKVFSLPEELRIQRTDNGRPFVDIENFHFSVAHSENVTAISVSASVNGCDLEKLREISREDALKKRVLKTLPDELFEDDNGPLRALSACEAALKYFQTANLTDISSFKFKNYRKTNIPLWTIQWKKLTCSVLEKRFGDKFLFIAYPENVDINCTIHRNYYTISG